MSWGLTQGGQLIELPGVPVRVRDPNDLQLHQIMHMTLDKNTEFIQPARFSLASEIRASRMKGQEGKVWESLTHDHRTSAKRHAAITIG